MKSLILAALLFTTLVQASLTPKPVRTVPASDISAIVTANYTIGANDFMVRYDSHLGSFNIQLPDPADRRELVFVDTRAGESDSNGVTLLQYGSEKIGVVASSKAISANSGSESAIWLISDGTHWRQVGITF